MERALALHELNLRVKNKNLIKHCLAVEAIMKRLARYFNEEEEAWGLAGLLHDIDYDITYNEPEKHSILGAEILEKLDIDPMIIYAVKAHNDVHNIERRRKIDKALFSADPVSGLITAGALIIPSKSLNDISVEFLLKRFNEKSFAKGANREHILKCSELDLCLEEFLSLSLQAMKDIAPELGL